jgi:serine phosphatase RsbU (regulator of sigma subunit)
MSVIIKKPVWKKWWFYLVIVTLLTLVIYYYINWRLERLKAEKRILEEKVRARTHEIQRQKDEIESQRDMIEEKNISITSSITYASFIQNAVLPPMELIDKLLPDNFILSKPKDIVSGDFYWLAEKDNKIIFTIADSTGHGVPGAFMSMLGITLLNEIVNLRGVTRSDEIVTELRTGIIQYLQQGRNDIALLNGIDLALCVLDRQSNVLQFTGGMNDLVYIDDGKLNVIKADRLDVSILSKNFPPFSVKEIKCKKGDMLYLFSDGYQDQFGGNYDKKFLRPHFYSTLFEMHKLPMAEQKETLENKLREWMKGNVQTDDITVMGIRL